jgi:phage baseplate assembly protein W
MKETYYDLPIRFDLLIQKNKELPNCSLDKSIAQNIFLIITSKFNEHRFDPDYGCEIWETDFELIHNVNIWKERVRKSIIQTITLHEVRLTNIDVDVDVNEEEIKIEAKNLITIKKRLAITIRAKTIKTGEPFIFSTKLFISPLSLD